MRSFFIIILFTFLIKNTFSLQQKENITITPLFKKISISNYNQLDFLIKINDADILEKILNQQNNYYYLKLIKNEKVLFKKKGIIKKNNQTIKINLLDENNKPYFQLTNDNLSLSYAFQFGDSFSEISQQIIKSDNIKFIYDSQSLLEIKKEIDKEIYIDENIKRFYIQTADIDLSSVKDFQPIGNVIDAKNGYEITKCFRGIYNGNNYKIKNLKINLPKKKFVGLFECLFDNALIYNVNLESAEVIGNYFVGGIAGGNKNSTISNCFVSGKIVGSEKSGGIAGANKTGIISHSFFRGSVNSVMSAGGIVGENSLSSTVKNSSSIANVKVSKYNSGGIVGLNINKSSVLQSYSFASVIGKKDVGGIVGDNKHYSKILNSYSVGSVKGEYGVGGIAGYNVDSVIRYCYSQVKHNGMGGVGSLVGYSIRSKCENSYATGYQIGEKKNKTKIQYMSFKQIREEKFKKFKNEFWIIKDKYWPILKEVALAPKQKLRLL